MIKKVLVYLFILIAALYGVRHLVYQGVLKNKKGVFEKYNTVFLKQNSYDVLFLGSSRVEMHYDTKVFDSITGHNSFNIGVTGATPRIAYGVLKAYCSKSEAPKFLVFDLDYHFLKYGVDTIRNFTRFFPYLDNSILFNQFNQIDRRFSAFKNNPFYSLPYSGIGLIAASLHGWLGVEGKDDDTFYKGFTKVNYRDTLKEVKLNPYSVFIHPTEHNYMDSIIQFTRKNGIKLLLTTSPMYSEVNSKMLNKPTMVQQLKNIAIANNLSYVDFSLRPYSYRKGYFIDLYHMNGAGARIFTLEFAPLFQQYFNKYSVK